MIKQPTFDIQELVKESGIPRRTVYFYVQQGILPPPEGAGLAAHYSGQHLLRLRLIPVLREQGLRLDEIRQRFEQMTPEEMERALKATEARQAAVGRPAPLPAVSDALQPAGVYHPSARHLLSEQRFHHYQLPAGITLVVPENLAPGEKQRLNLLLQAAAQIFTGPTAPAVYGIDGQVQSNSESKDEAAEDTHG